MPVVILSYCQAVVMERLLQEPVGDKSRLPLPVAGRVFLNRMDSDDFRVATEGLMRLGLAERHTSAWRALRALKGTSQTRRDLAWWIRTARPGQRAEFDFPDPLPPAAPSYEVGGSLPDAPQ